MAMTRSSLLESELPKMPWGELLSILVYLTHRMPPEAMDEDTVFALVQSRSKPGTLRIIGVRPFVHVETHTTKLQKKAWEDNYRL